MGDMPKHFHVNKRVPVYDYTDPFDYLVTFFIDHEQKEVAHNVGQHAAF